MKEPQLIKNIKKYEDSRGCFYQSYDCDMFFEKNTSFIVDNHSISKKNVIRGLHYQWDKPLGKLVRVSKGKIQDVLVDIRKSSPNFGNVLYYELSDENLFQLWVPPGFAHGFCVLSEEAHVQYKFTEKYNPHGESGIDAFDKKLNINWKVNKEEAIISDKDLQLQSFFEYSKNYKF